jgi:hypothetical protein
LKQPAEALAGRSGPLQGIQKAPCAGIVPEVQAKAQVEVIREVIKDKPATKQDLKELEYRLEYRLTLRFGAQ